MSDFESQKQDNNLLCEQLKKQWEDGRNPRLADFLQNCSGHVDDALLCRLVRIDLDQRRNRAKLQQPPTGLSNETKTNLSVSAGEASTLKNIRAKRNEDSTVLAVNTPYRAGDTIDRYQLVEPIGVGGMGAVWKAIQQEPVKRIVALKLVREDSGSEKATDRFEAERQAIAMMDHQNIAKIFDAGTTDRGAPFFVMELVDGMRLDAYCDKHSFSIQQRLELVIPICSAVQHAHQKGIIHRDLKLSNILVCEADGQPVPKVIDFGLAKTFDRNALSDRTAFTELGYVVGTLQYMSPEQSESNNQDVDTRSDLYSLGALIYKLLTGIAPIESCGQEMSVFEALSWVREKDPLTPGAWFRSPSSDLQTVLAAADAMQLTCEKAASIIIGDLDSVVMKALEKDRDNRYQTASELAADINRFLSDQPVLARSSTPWSRGRKFVKRNRGLVISLAVTTLLLLGGILGTSYGLFIAIKAQQGLRESETKLSRQLKSITKQSAWAHWQNGRVTTAWETLKQLDEADEDWLTKHLMTKMNSSDHVLYGHARQVMAIDISSNDKLIATGGHDDTVKLWDLETGKLLASFMTDDSVTSVDFAPDSKSLAYADRSNRVVILDCKTLQRLVEFAQFDQDISCVRFSPDGETLVAATSGSDSIRSIGSRDFINIHLPDIYVLSPHDQSTLQTLQRHKKEITTMSMGPNGDTLVSGDMAGRCCFWRKKDGKYSFEKELETDPLGTRGIAFSPNGNLLAIAGSDQTIKLWDVDNWENIRTFAGHEDVIHSVDFSPDGSQILSASSDASAIIWDVQGARQHEFRGHYQALNAAVFSSDGKKIVTASDDHTARIWKTSTHTELTCHLHNTTVWMIDDSPDGQLIASAGEDGFVVLTDIDTGVKIPKKLRHPQPVLSLAFLKNGCLATGCADGNLRIWNVQTQSLMQTINAHGDYIWDVSVAPDGCSLVTAGEDSLAKQWDTSTWKLMQEFIGHESGMGSARFSPDGTQLLTASDDETVCLWDINSGTLLHAFADPIDSIWRAIFSPDGKWIASSSFDGEIILWDSESKEMITRIQGHSSQTAGLTFSKDGSQLVSASDDGNIKFWDVESLLCKDNANAELIVLTDLPDLQAIHVSFSSDGTKLLSGGMDTVTIRSANMSIQQPPFLIEDANRLIAETEILVAQDDITEKNIERVVANSQKCCRFFPSYKSFTFLGLSQYLEDQLPEAKASLEEAYRLQKLTYRHPDRPPAIEGLLAMVYLRTGEVVAAQKMRQLFEAKYQEENWSQDAPMKKLSNMLSQLNQQPDLEKAEP